MRISTSEFILGALPEMLAQQSNVNQLNREVATGQTMLDATSDPAGAGLAIQTASQIQHLTYDVSNANAGTQTIQNALAALQQVTTVIEQLRQTALSGANAATTADQRQALVPVAQNALAQLVQLANTQAANGTYLFGGSKVDTAPFVGEADGQVGFTGDAGTNMVEIAPGLSVPVTASGQGIFVDVPAGTDGAVVTADAANAGSATAQVRGITSLAQVAAERLAGTQYAIAFTDAPGGGLAYTVTSGSGSPGSSGFAASSGIIASGGFTAGSDLQFAGLDIAVNGAPAAGDGYVVATGASSSLFQSVQDLIGALETAQPGQPANSSALQQIQNVIGNLDNAQNAILTSEASLGAGLSEIQSIEGQDQTQGTNAQAQLSNLQSANLPQVLANYSASVTALQAAEEAFARIQNLTLFSVIGP
jgi:flagellar hook-associated protein 3 FlgL